MREDSHYQPGIEFFIENLMLIYYSVVQQITEKREIDQHEIDVSFTSWLESESGQPFAKFLQDFSKEFRQILLENIISVDACEDNEAIAVYSNLLWGYGQKLGLFSLIRSSEKYVIGSLPITMQQILVNLNQFFEKYDCNYTLLNFLQMKKSKFSEANETFVKFHAQKFLQDQFSQTQLPETEEFYDSEEVKNDCDSSGDPQQKLADLTARLYACTRIQRYLAYLLNDESLKDLSFPRFSYGPLSFQENLHQNHTVDIGAYDSPHTKSLKPCVMLSFDLNLHTNGNFEQEFSLIKQFIEKWNEQLEADKRCEISQKIYAQSRTPNQERFDKLPETSRNLSRLPEKMQGKQIRLLAKEPIFDNRLRLIIITGKLEALQALHTELKSEYLKRREPSVSGAINTLGLFSSFPLTPPPSPDLNSDEDTHHRKKQKNRHNGKESSSSFPNVNV